MEISYAEFGIVQDTKSIRQFIETYDIHHPYLITPDGIMLTESEIDRGSNPQINHCLQSGS